MTEANKTRPESTIVVVDLGFAVARVKRDWHLNGCAWELTTTLTLLTPCSSEDGVHEPAQSCSAYMSYKNRIALIEALSP